MSDTSRDGISQLLLQQQAAKPRTGEDLEVFGKHAAMMWLRGEAPNMSAAVVETVKKASLSPEQVLRVVEFANTNAFLTEFKKEGRAHRVIDFPGGPADPATVLRDLNDGGGGAGRVSTKVASLEDYASPPKQASKGDILWHREVEAPAPMAQANPLGEAMQLRSKLAGVAEHARGQLNFAERAYRESVLEMQEQVKSAALEGVPLSEVVRVFAEVCPNETFIKHAFEVVSPKLVQSRVFRTPSDMEDSFRKQASSDPVNPAHPLVTAYSVFCQSIDKCAELRQVIGEYQESVEQLDHFLKIAAQPGDIGKAFAALGPAATRAGQAFQNTKGVIPAASAALGEMAPHVGETARAVTSGLMGDGKASRAAKFIAEKGTQHAVPIAGGLAAWQASRTPEVQRAMYEANSRFNPLSRAYDERDYMLQTGQI